MTSAAPSGGLLRHYPGPSQFAPGLVHVRPVAFLLDPAQERLVMDDLDKLLDRTAQR